ncbi:MAG: Gfo/Idh/MocA family oxidoreductase [bacterium]
MSQRLKVGVVGVGSLGQWHADKYSRLDSAELVGVYDVNPARAGEIAAKYKTKTFDTVEALAGVIEAASVAVPAEHHFKVASLLMDRGIHLMVEKPIASTTDQAETMVRLAEKKGLILQVGHIERFNPVMKYLEEILHAPKFIESVRLSPYPVPAAGATARGTDVSVVHDLMIHDLEIILHLVRSPIKELHAIGVPVLSATEDIANVRLCFVSGCVANVTASRISVKGIRKIRVFQESTYVSLDYQNQSGELYRKTEKGISMEQVPIEKSDPLADELKTFVQCVLNRDKPVVSGRHASDALRLAVEICECIRKGGS